MVTSFNFRKFAKEITGKRVIVRKDGNVRAFHTLKSIIVCNVVPMYYVIHEVCHFIVASSEDKKKYNLRYGKDDNHGYSMPESDERHDACREERLVGELQKHLINKFKLGNIIFETEDNEQINNYLEYIREYEKPQDEDSLLGEAFNRMKETNKEYCIDIENILSINLKREIGGNI